MRADKTGGRWSEFRPITGWKSTPGWRSARKLSPRAPPIAAVAPTPSAPQPVVNVAVRPSPARCVAVESIWLGTSMHRGSSAAGQVPCSGGKMAASCSAHAAAERDEVEDEVVAKEVAGRDPVFAQMLAAIDAKSIDTPEVQKVGRGGPRR